MTRFPKKLKVGIIGLGIGTTHLVEGYRGNPNYEVVGLCDTNVDLLAIESKRFGIPGFKDYQALADLPIDIIDICTPPHLHFEMLCWAINLHKHVICEKPFLNDIGQLSFIETLANQNQVQICPISQFKCGPAWEQIIDLKNKGLLGKPHLAVANLSWRRESDYYRGWRAQKEQHFDGIFANHAIHLLDMLVDVMGNVETIKGFDSVLANPVGFKDTLSASLQFESGALGTISGSLNSASETTFLHMVFEHATISSDLTPYNPTALPWKIQMKSLEQIQVPETTSFRYRRQMQLIWDQIHNNTSNDLSRVRHLMQVINQL